MTIKTQAKAATRNARKSAPIAKPPKPVVNNCHALIVAAFRAYKNVDKVEGTEYTAFKAVILAAPLKDHKGLSAVQKDIREVFGETHKDAATIRCTILNNAKKLEHGAVKDKRVIKGKGRAELVKVLDSVTSIRALRKALTDAKPEGLKDARGGDRTPAKPAIVKKDASLKTLAPNVTVPADKAHAIEAACKVLEFVATNFLSIAHDGTALTSVYATVKLLKAVHVDEAEDDNEQLAA